ncbi:MAG: histidine kinase [Rhodanobacter sp. SCN 68-63]|nr:MAG: histidine kinase [Rhodanobacter sp. SCN 68-63]
MTHMLPSPASPPRNDALALRVLIADDDAASRRFLLDAVRALGADATDCADGAEALGVARNEMFDLLLLRKDAFAASRDALAIATSAELDTAQRALLLAEGFSDVLAKPCRIDDLRRVVALAPAYLNRLPVLDDEAALLASGDSTTMRALRQLLQQELLTLCSELDQLGQDGTALRDRLHRLRSSCGFCGATALSGHVVALQQQLTGARPEQAASAVVRFRGVLMETLRALDRPQQAA